MLVGVDVCGDLLSRLVQRLPLRSPGQAFLELSEPGLDEGLGLWIAVAAPSVGDPAGRQVAAEVAGGELAALSVPSVSRPGWTPRSITAASTQAIASSSRQRSSSDQPTSSRVQQSMMACR
jgi:hypothetical protein